MMRFTSLLLLVQNLPSVIRAVLDGQTANRAGMRIQIGANSDAFLIKKAAPQKPVVLYGIESCNSGPYNLMVKAQLDTWGANLSRESLIIVGGEHDDHKDKLVENEMSCDDSQDALTCKEGVLLARAVERARKLNANWLVLGQDDKYVWPTEMEQAVSKLNPATPQIFSSFGCGQAWEFHKESEHGTQPLPPGWVNPQFSCKAVWENAGICGGPAYIMSRGALEKLFKPGQSSASFVEEFVAGSKAPGGQSDMAASCMFYERGIPFKNPMGDLGRSVDVNMDDLTRKGMEGYILSDVKGSSSHAPLTAHITIKKDMIPEFLKKTADVFSQSLLEETDSLQMNQSSWAFATQKADFLYALHRKTIGGLFSS